MVELDHANGLTFHCIFNLFIRGSVAGIAPFPWPLEDGNCPGGYSLYLDDRDDRRTF